MKNADVYHIHKNEIDPVCRGSYCTNATNYHGQCWNGLCKHVLT